MSKERIPVDAAIIDEAVDDFRQKLCDRLQEKGDLSFIGPHEIYGVISEEYHELDQAVRGNNEGEVKDELLDIAVGAVFGYASLLQYKLDSTQRKVKG